MERLWSQAGATGGNHSQMEWPRKRLKEADRQPVATHGNGSAAHGKEHVCHRLPPVAATPFLLKRGSPSWLRKDVESRESEVTQDSTSNLHEIGD
jgi:hypothetical protein